MSSNITTKPVSVLAAPSQAHPFEAGVRQDISALRGKLTQLRKSAHSDPFFKSQVKNLEAQLGKKNAYLATLTASVGKPAADVAPKKLSVESKLSPTPRKQVEQGAMPAAPEQSFGALGARLKGRLTPNIAAQLAPEASIDIERF